MSNSKSCFCASSLAMFFGLAISFFGLALLLMVTIDKKSSSLNDKKGAITTPSPFNGQGGRPIYQPPTMAPPPGEKNDKEPFLDTSGMFSTDNPDFYILLTAFFAVGLIITSLGFLCSLCAICCCSRSPSTIEPSEPKEWTVE